MAQSLSVVLYPSQSSGRTELVDQAFLRPDADTKYTRCTHKQIQLYYDCEITVAAVHTVESVDGFATA